MFDGVNRSFVRGIDNRDKFQKAWRTCVILSSLRPAVKVVAAFAVTGPKSRPGHKMSRLEDLGVSVFKNASSYSYMKKLSEKNCEARAVMLDQHYDTARTRPISNPLLYNPILRS